MCGDALRDKGYQLLVEGDLAQMLVTDPPYNVRIKGHAMGRGKMRHREFKMASGEMSEEAFTAFLETFIRNAVAFSTDGSIHYLFIDWRHLPELLAAARPLYAEWKNLLVWSKTNAGQGSFLSLEARADRRLQKRHRAAHQQFRAWRQRPISHATSSIIRASTVCTRPGVASSTCTPRSSQSRSSPT